MEVYFGKYWVFRNVFRYFSICVRKCLWLSLICLQFLRTLGFFVVFGVYSRIIQALMLLNEVPNSACWSVWYWLSGVLVFVVEIALIGDKLHFFEQPFVQITQDLIVGYDFDEELNFVLFFPVLETAMIDFFLNFDLLLYLIDAIHKECFHVGLSFEDIALVWVEKLIFPF